MRRSLHFAVRKVTGLELGVVLVVGGHGDGRGGGGGGGGARVYRWETGG
jgi:hypothetical protein